MEELMVVFFKIILAFTSVGLVIGVGRVIALRKNYYPRPVNLRKWYAVRLIQACYCASYLSFIAWALIIVSIMFLAEARLNSDPGAIITFFRGHMLLLFCILVTSIPTYFLLSNHPVIKQTLPNLAS